MCFNLTRRSRCNSSSRCCYRAREHVDPTWSRKIRCGGDSHPETPSSPGSVGLARAHPLTKTQAMEPSRQTRSSYGPPYPLGRWSSEYVSRAARWYDRQPHCFQSILIASSIISKPHLQTLFANFIWKPHFQTTSFTVSYRDTSLIHCIHTW